MGNKRNSKSVIVTIIVTVVVLAVLSVIGIRYLMPSFAQSQGDDVDMQYTIYTYAVRLFPLLVGIVLIIIASMIASNREDDVDEDDLLPPNSYDQQLFETPADDPVKRVEPQKRPEVAKEKEPEEVVSSDSISDDEFFAIFNDNGDSKQEDKASGLDDEVSSLLYEDDSLEEMPEEEPVATLDFQQPEEETEPEAVEPAAEEKPAEEPVEEPAAVEPSEEPVEEPAAAAPVTVVQTVQDTSALEQKIDKLCDTIEKLAALVAAGHIAATAAPQPVSEAAPAVEEPTVEEPAVEEPVVVQPAVEEPVIEKAEVPPEQQVINDYDANNPMHLMRIEYDSAQEDQYDITFAFTSATADQVKFALSEVADAYEVNGKTVVVIPFLSEEEALSELEKENIVCSDSVFVAAGSNGDFDSVIAPKL